MFKPKRSLGQNFFINRTLAVKIIKNVLSLEPKSVLEIGPGTGSFTNLLYKEEIPLLCIEKDDELAHLIDSKFPRATVLNQDILDINFDELEKLLPEDRPRICFGSLPYNISKKIIRMFLESELFDEYYFIIQKEVAQKYVGREKSSILSLTSSIYADSKIILNISGSSFKPKPNVTSSLIQFKSNTKIPDREESLRLQKVIKSSFARPRKTLSNNLKSNYTFNDDLYKMRRAENMTLEEFRGLEKTLTHLKA